MTFHEKLKRLTEDRKCSVLCRRIGLPPYTIANYLCKKQTPSAPIALRLARVLGVDLAWLVDDEQGWPPVRAHEAELQGAA